MTAARITPKERHARMLEQEAGRSVFMRIADHGSFERERFIEVNRGAARAYAFAPHGPARRRRERM
jgi:rare lipoprotein A (peptidoglycan hydrolase)